MLAKLRSVVDFEAQGLLPERRAFFYAMFLKARVQLLKGCMFLVKVFPTDVKQWGVTHVQRWLDIISMSEYKPKFKAAAVDGEKVKTFAFPWV